MDNAQTGKLIAQLRKQQGLTQQQLADQLYLSNKTISKWESGAGSPDISNLPLLADALGTTVDALLRGVPPQPEEAAPVPPSHPANEITATQKKERVLIALFACGGAVLGILAYNLGWLG